MHLEFGFFAHETCLTNLAYFYIKKVSRRKWKPAKNVDDFLSSFFSIGTAIMDASLQAIREAGLKAFDPTQPNTKAIQEFEALIERQAQRTAHYSNHI